MLALAGLVCGFIFGLGLLISGMTQPTKVLGFLDIFGAWDPSLAVVMAAALAVSGIGFAVIKRRTPLLAPQASGLRAPTSIPRYSPARPCSASVGGWSDCVPDRRSRTSRHCRRASSPSSPPWRPEWCCTMGCRRGAPRARSLPPRAPRTDSSSAKMT
jgi:hypothetical protein